MTRRQGNRLGRQQHWKTSQSRAERRRRLYGTGSASDDAEPIVLEEVEGPIQATCDSPPQCMPFERDAIADEEVRFDDGGVVKKDVATGSETESEEFSEPGIQSSPNMVGGWSNTNEDTSAPAVPDVWGGGVEQIGTEPCPSFW